MNTREKIVQAEKAVSLAAQWRVSGTAFDVVSGYFDVLQPGMVGRLEAISQAGQRLFAIVLDSPEALLAIAGRAELAAALRVIDYVIPFAGNPDELVRTMQPRHWVREEIAHRQSVEQLMAHVFERHGLERERRPGD